PFVHGAELEGPRGEVVRFRGVVDDGAMVNAIDSGSYQEKGTRLERLETSGRWLRMADGRLTPSLGVWRGKVSMGGIARRGEFEVFDSGGAWTLLIGKPMLESYKAVHDYATDSIHIPRTGTS
ncbi:hypothetical protein FA15DRAFT_553620, partial [Coprinopsis marcescibilis]